MIQRCVFCDGIFWPWQSGGWWFRFDGKQVRWHRRCFQRWEAAKQTMTWSQPVTSRGRVRSEGPGLLSAPVASEEHLFDIEPEVDLDEWSLFLDQYGVGLEARYADGDR